MQITKELVILVTYALLVTSQTTTTTRKTTTTTKTSSTKTTTAKTTSYSWQASGGVNCPHPAVNTQWPTASVTSSFPTASLIAPNGVFDGGMKMYDRAGSAGDCKGQTEQEEDAAVFILDSGATLKNVIIGARQAEGVHCRGPCTLENVWWDDV